MIGPSALGSALPPNPLEREGSPAAANANKMTPDHRMARVDRSKVDPGTVRAAEGMETMFLDYMMKIMRSTVPESEMSLNNTATEIYQQSLDSEYAKRAANAGGVGLADQIIAYIEAQRYTQKTPGGKPGAP